MRKSIVTMILIVLFVSTFANNITIDQTSHHDYKILSDDEIKLELSFGVSDINVSDVKTEKGYFSKIDLGKGYFSDEIGKASLPVFRNLIEIPYDAEPEVKVVSYNEKIYNLEDIGMNYPILPVQPKYSKSSLESERKFIYNMDFYKTDKFTENSIAKVQKSGVMRGVGVANLEIAPISYNPVTNEIKVFTDIIVEVNYNSSISSNNFKKNEEYSAFFEKQYSSLINFRSISSKVDLTAYPVTYLIVASDQLDGNAKLQELIDWKTEKGFNVVVNYVSSTSTTGEIDTWIEDQYANLDPKPTFILIVGDEDGTFRVATEMSPPLGSIGGVTVSDLLYSVISATANDNRIPSMYIGRFSVQSLTDLDAQVDKTIWYEKTQFTSGADLSYLTNVLGVAGVDGSYASSHGNPQINYGMAYYFNDNYRIPLDGTKSNINGISYLYPASDAVGVNSEVIAHISNGVAFYNYTAHGYNGGFADPSFTISNVNALTNVGQYPLVVGNCCLTGSFGDNECFGEAWLNAPDKGGIGFIGASMSTYWDEDLAMGVGEAAIGDTTPVFSQDKQGMYDGVMMMDYPTQGGVKFAGLLAVETLGGSYVSAYWSSYHLFGDPSLMVYYGVPGENTVSHLPTVDPGATTYEITALEGSYVALTDDSGVLHGAGVVSELGSITIDITPFVSGNAHLVVTSQFKQPHIEDIPVAALTGPYISINNFTVNGNLFGSTATADIELKNVGIEISTNVNIVASTDNTYITLSDNTENYGTLAVDGTLNIQDCISFDIDHNIPDQEDIVINIEVTDDYSKNTYQGSINFIASAPKLVFNRTLPSGVIDPGDSAPMTFNIENTGSADITNFTVDLAETNGMIVTITDPVDIVLLAAGENVDVDFTCDFDVSIPNTTTAYFNLNISNADGFTQDDPFEVVLGMTEDYETGDYTANEWTLIGDSNWFIDTTTFYDGANSSRSGNIGDNEYSRMSLTFDFPDVGSISFYKMVSSEPGYDFLRFYIDEILQDYWSGVTGWEKVSYDIPAGIHDLHWQYDKDVNSLGGSDCAWIDNILISGGTTGIEEEFGNLPNDSKLYQNYPNPFNPVTEINFYISNDNEVRLSIFNSSGQLVKELVNEKLNKGMHTAIFNAGNLNSGIYFYTLGVNNNKFSNKMLLIK
ncbi:MAG: T9SS type A sorting domain-containing protein [Candidatus Delongbacteria bacterium]|nr:T9SS type A sorting domain-containing protein [Candidatus Delongbacteria bacterium]